MREIKFRAWDKESKKMVSIGNIAWDTVGKLLSVRDDWYGENVWAPGKCFENIMQYTGLKDKNGKEIYEGDIVRVYNDYLIKISWRDDLGSWDIARFKDNEVFDSCDFEIIGNIFENPELLKHI